MIHTPIHQAKNKLKTIVVMPACNAEATLGKTISEIPFDCVLGSRIRSRRKALSGGIPFYKYIE